MLNFSFSLYDLEYFLLVFTRVSCFVFVAPFFSMSNTPRHVRVALSFFTAALLYETLTPAQMAITYNTVMGYAVIVIKEAVVGLLIGYSANLCTTIVNFAGSIVDMETGLAMAQVMDPTTKQTTSITGGLYQYIMTLLLIATGMYRYLMGALADTFILIPINGAIFNTDALLSSMLKFMSSYIIIGFRIALPVFCTMLLLNAILGVLAKVSPQLNMFAVGIQIKILVGLAILFFSVSMLPGAADFIFVQMKDLMSDFVGAMGGQL